MPDTSSAEHGAMSPTFDNGADSTVGVTYKIQLWSVKPPLVASFISFVSVALLLCLLVLFTITGRTRTQKPFMKTHIGAYFLSLMLADLTLAIRGVISVRWLQAGQIYAGSLCTAQAALTQLSNVSVATWPAIIAVHTVRVLLFDSHASNTECAVTLLMAWSLSVVSVVIGPAALQTKDGGAYYGPVKEFTQHPNQPPVHGFGICWITVQYPQAQRLFLLEYVYMFASAVVSIVAYTMIFFRLRGNLIAEGWRLRIIRVPSSRAWNLSAGRAVMEYDTMKIAWQLMLYPLAHILLVLPIAGARWSNYIGRKTPRNVELMGRVVLMLDGFVDVVLFVATRRVFPPIKFRREATTTSEPSTALSTNVFADLTQGSAENNKSDQPPTFSSPSTSFLEMQEQVDDPQILPLVEKGEERMSGESTRASTIGTSQHE